METIILVAIILVAVLGGQAFMYFIDMGAEKRRIETARIISEKVKELIQIDIENYRGGRA